VVFVLKGYPRLSETFIAQEILGLEQAGLPIEIVSLRHPTETQRHPVHREIKAPVAYLPEYLHDEPGRVLRAVAVCALRRRFLPALRMFLADFAHDRSRNRLRRFGQALVLAAERRTPPRQIHAHFIHTPASVARYAAALLDVPWSCSAHAKDIWTSGDSELATKLADVAWAVTCTQAGADRLNALAPPARPVHLVYHGLDLDRFRPLNAPLAIRDGRDKGHPVRLLAVGRAVEKKGFDLLLQALAAVPGELNWRLHHIGGGEKLPTLKEQARQLGIDSRIAWLGAQPQELVLHECREADLFVLPSRIAGDGDRDGLPNVLMEAQSQAVCCLSTRVSAIPELILDGETGRLVPPGDVPELAAALAELIVDPGLRYRLGKAGERRVRGQFSHRGGLVRLMDLFANGRAARAVRLPDAAE